MSDPDRPAPNASGDGIDGYIQPGPGNVKLIYLLYLLSFVLGLTWLVGVVFAYVNRGKSDPWLETHYTWIIRTFWISLLYSLIAAVLALVVIGFLLFIAVAIWIIVRCVIGLQKVARNEPIDNPQSWMI